MTCGSFVNCFWFGGTQIVDILPCCPVTFLWQLNCMMWVGGMSLSLSLCIVHLRVLWFLSRSLERSPFATIIFMWEFSSFTLVAQPWASFCLTYLLDSSLCDLSPEKLKVNRHLTYSSCWITEAKNGCKHRTVGRAILSNAVRKYHSRFLIGPTFFFLTSEKQRWFLWLHRTFFRAKIYDMAF